MKTIKILCALVMAMAVLISQVGAVFAAPAMKKSIHGIVTSLTCETDTITADKTFLVTVQGIDGILQTVRIDQLTANSLGLIGITADGNPDCRQEVLDTASGMEITIDAADILTAQEEKQHPVGAALATFFGEITDYNAIMEAHENGAGFGMIAQVLWLTKKMDGDTETFLAILLAKKTGDYSAFTYEEGVAIPQNWGQFRKLILNGDKKNSLGIVMSDKGKENGNNSGGNGDGQGQGNNNHGNNNKNDEKGNNGQNEDKGNGNNK